MREMRRGASAEELATADWGQTQTVPAGQLFAGEPLAVDAEQWTPSNGRCAELLQPPLLFPRDIIGRNVFNARSLVAGQFFFVFAELLLHFLGGGIHRGNDRSGIGRSHELRCMLRPDVDFYPRVLLVLEVDRDLDRVDAIVIA